MPPQVTTFRAHGNCPLAPRLIAPCGDPLALVRRFLHVPYAAPAVMSLARLHRAEETLQRWRVKVADWREMPSAPAPTETIARMQEALVSHVDSGAVLIQLHRVETDLHLTSGGKFDVFTGIDRVLSLDLRHLMGRRPR